MKQLPVTESTSKCCNVYCPKRSCGKATFSQTSVCSQKGTGSHVSITQDALGLTVQGPPSSQTRCPSLPSSSPQIPEMGPKALSVVPSLLSLSCPPPFLFDTLITLQCTDFGGLTGANHDSQHNIYVQPTVFTLYSWLNILIGEDLGWIKCPDNLSQFSVSIHTEPLSENKCEQSLELALYDL